MVFKLSKCGHYLWTRLVFIVEISICQKGYWDIQDNFSH